MSFAEQCRDAETIVVGTVRAVTSRRSPAAPSFFETVVTIAVEETVAGQSSAERTLRLAGGEVGSVRQSIDGMPELAPGERYVLFLDAEHDPPTISPFTGFNQGLYRVERVGGRDVVRDRLGRALPGDVMAALASSETERRASGIAPPTAAAPSLEGFVAAIHAARP